MDHLQAPLNPCSLETIPTPVELADGQKVWPLMLSCYQLENDGSRRGRMDLYTVKVPDIAGSNLSSMPLHFGEPHNILSIKTSGILDGKWAAMPANEQQAKRWSFATAHSSGEIRIHAFQVAPPDPDLPRLDSDPPYTVKYLGQSDLSDSKTDRPPLCLSLNWDPSVSSDDADSGLSRIVSSYSNGRVAIHDVAYLSDGVSVIERDSWQAHNMFTSPAEVWSACFAHDGDRNMVLSCGDEGNIKFWDVRSTSRPIQILKHFQAGATCVSHHPRNEHLVACGSYDETMFLYDVRYMSQTPLCHSRELGGGIWRIKWHPYQDNRLLVAAMHGGCRAMKVNEWKSISEDLSSSVEAAPVSLKATRKFTEHESMAYGADWLVCPHPTQNGYFEAAASCSFYDRAVYLWDSVF